MMHALDKHSALGNLPFAVEDFEVQFIDGRTIAIVDGLDLEDMPNETVTLLKSGKASVKNLAVGKRVEQRTERARLIELAGEHAVGPVGEAAQDQYCQGPAVGVRAQQQPQEQRNAEQSGETEQVRHGQDDTAGQVVRRGGHRGRRVRTQPSRLPPPIASIAGGD